MFPVGGFHPGNFKFLHPSEIWPNMGRRKLGPPLEKWNKISSIILSFVGDKQKKNDAGESILSCSFIYSWIDKCELCSALICDHSQSIIACFKVMHILSVLKQKYWVIRPTKSFYGVYRVFTQLLWNCMDRIAYKSLHLAFLLFADLERDMMFTTWRRKTI